MPSWKKIIVSGSNAELSTLKITSGSYISFDTTQNNLFTYTERASHRVFSPNYLNSYRTTRTVAGDSITPTTVTATQWDLVHCTGSIGAPEWNVVDQTTNSSTKLLGIYDGTNVVTEGYVPVVREGDGGDGTAVTIKADNLTPGSPVYILSGSNSTPFLSTEVPLTGYVRIVGHIINSSEDDGIDYGIMRFRPDHTWVQI